MSKDSRVRTIRFPLSKIRSAVPAFALIASGILLSPSAAPAAGLRATPISNGSAVVTVPDVAITMPGSINVLGDPQPLRRPGATLPALAAPRPPVSILPAGTVPGSSSLVTLDSSGIPDRALAAYRQAASLVDSADPGCHLDWALLAAIGRVESNHARFGGNQLDSAGVAQPGIIGIPLDGSNGTALITDSDGGLLDRDTTYDRAVGPMQFIPSTWRFAGVDADGDGVKNPQDMADAASATAVYLCSGPGDVRVPDELRSAILRYNASDSYVRTVTAIAEAYREGVTALPASALPAANPARSTSGATRQVTSPTHGKRALGRSGPTTTTSRARPAAQTGSPVTIPPTSLVVQTTPGVPDPVVTIPVVPDPVVTVPDPLIPCVPAAPLTVPISSVPTGTNAAPLVPCVSVPAVTVTVAPDLCLPDSAATVPPLPTPTGTITAAPVPCLVDQAVTLPVVSVP